MRLGISLLGLFAAAPAAAADNELSFEFGSLHNDDSSYALFSSEESMPSIGMRAGFAFHDRLSARLGWQHVRQGADVSVGEEQSDSHISSAFYGDELSLGVRADVPLGDFVLPYVSVDGLGFRAKVRFDDDATDEDSPGQVEETAFAPGALAMGGAELRIPIGRLYPTSKAELALGLNLEVGYALVGQLDFGDLGQMKPGGLAVRSGVGIRF